jgi:hypothetical protein
VHLPRTTDHGSGNAILVSASFDTTAWLRLTVSVAHTTILTPLPRADISFMVPLSRMQEPRTASHVSQTMLAWCYIPYTGYFAERFSRSGNCRHGSTQPGSHTSLLIGLAVHQRREKVTGDCEEDSGSFRGGVATGFHSALRSSLYPDLLARLTSRALARKHDSWSCGARSSPPPLDCVPVPPGVYPTRRRRETPTTPRNDMYVASTDSSSRVRAHDS